MMGIGAGRHPSYVATFLDWYVAGPRLEKSLTDDKEDKGDLVYGNNRA